jgi:hypothetical protein
MVQARELSEGEARAALEKAAGQPTYRQREAARWALAKLGDGGRR